MLSPPLIVAGQVPSIAAATAGRMTLTGRMPGRNPFRALSKRPGLCYPAAMTTPTGLHHVTAIASDPQTNIDFYAGLLGLRLIKKTVNFDDPSAYHLYYGDETGTPGTIITFFYWPGNGIRGRVGPGQMTRISFSAAPTSLDYWLRRLTSHGLSAQRVTRFGEDVITFSDPDGIPLEIVAVAQDARQGWTGGALPPEHALRGMHTAELAVGVAGPTEDVLTRTMNYRLVRREGDRARFEAGSGGSGAFVDLLTDNHRARGTGGAGTIHHIAWRVPDDKSELAMQEKLNRAGLGVSPVRDRNYFRSIYYREPNGILFEVATDSPGFAIDEPLASLGLSLKLPAEFERSRREIETFLPPLREARPYDARSGVARAMST
jgi:glyoxalase family protein